MLVISSNQPIVTLAANAAPPAPPHSFYKFRIVRFYYRYLRALVLNVCLASCVFAGVTGGYAIREYFSDRSVTLGLSRLDMARAILDVLVLAIGLFGLGAVYFKSPVDIKKYFFLSLGSTACVVIGETIQVVGHFQFKSDIVWYCVSSLEPVTPSCTDLPCPGWSDGTSSMCYSQWISKSKPTIIWAIVTSLLAVLFSIIVWGYLQATTIRKNNIDGVEAQEIGLSPVPLQMRNAFDARPHQSHQGTQIVYSTDEMTRTPDHPSQSNPPEYSEHAPQIYVMEGKGLGN